MAAITLANAIIAAGSDLYDPTYQVHVGGYTAGTTTYLSAKVTQTANEISTVHPLAKRCNLAIISNTWDVDLSLLTYSRIREVFHPADSEDNRDFDEYGTTLKVQMDNVPVTIVSGALTGTVTFTINSRSVTGSGTAFTTELQVGYLLCKGKVADAAFKYYSIAYITSDTALTLAEPFEEASGADTVSLTKYRAPSSCLRINYDGIYTVSTSSDMPQRFDDLLVMGTVAHAATEYAAGKAATNLTDVTAKIVLAAAEITTSGKAAAQLILAVSDILAARTSFNTTNATVIGTDLTAIGTALDNCLADLDSGLALANTVNVGGETVTTKYTEAARADVEEARARTDKVRAYIDVTKPNLDMAVQELQATTGYINSATTYLQMADRDINASQLISSYKSWAQMKWMEYQTGLRNIRKIKVHQFGSRN